ncbi:YbaN family protein [Brevundimonas sp.]|uniref:YbaN family protein n=1 Tax=Brevundimonas sp. TaxID=1871086 RepID=UPI002FC92CB9
MTRDPMTTRSRAAYDEAACPADLCSCGDWCCTPAEPGPGARVLALRTLGGAALIMGAVGVATPLVPATPFLLLATWAFARSSPRLEAWLITHPRLGPPVHAWRSRRAIPRPAKAVAVTSLLVSGAGLLLIGANGTVLAAAGATFAGVGGWILSRPS